MINVSRVGAITSTIVMKPNNFAVLHQHDSCEFLKLLCRYRCHHLNNEIINVVGDISKTGVELSTLERN